MEGVDRFLMGGAVGGRSIPQWGQRSQSGLMFLPQWGQLGNRLLLTDFD